jgi:hypothetical protein
VRANELYRGGERGMDSLLWKAALCIGATVVATEVGGWVYVSKALSLARLTLSWLWVGVVTAWIVVWRKCEKSDKVAWR